MEIGRDIDPVPGDDGGTEQRGRRRGTKRSGNGDGGTRKTARGRGNGGRRKVGGDGGEGGNGGAREAELRMVLDSLRSLEAGDFSVRLGYGSDPLMAEIAQTFNNVATLNERLTTEVARVSTVVGREGQMTERAGIGPVGGGWKTTVDQVNNLITDLLQPTSEVARVIEAVARGDLGQKMVLEIEGKSVQGEFLRIGSTVNTMVDQLSAFASEVTRVAREVGTEGILGGQANVPGVAGTWKDLTDSVNAMASNLTNQVRNIADVTTAVARGDLSRKITVEARGEILELKDTVNTMVDQLNAFAGEVTRVAREVGTEGQLGGQANVPGVAGTWKDLTDNVNTLASNLTVQLRDVSGVATAIASGDLTRKITVEARGEILQIKEVINKMVDSLSVFAGEVTRVAREVGAEGRLGGQANVPGVGGTWKDLTDNVNFMASSLTTQVRNIAEVTTAVARGDLSRKITVDAKGEVLELKNTINIMVDQLNSFASDVTRVAREVGTEGKLGG
ncbi:MAG: HAMP domain-containing protein, partial [Gemmatimonadaceae bacterium]